VTILGSRRALARGAVGSAVLLLGPRAARAQDGLDSGDTAWMLVSTALVLFMTLPGLALFYGGLVRAKNVLSVLMQCFALTGIVTLLWLAFGYSVAFEPSGYEKGVVGLHSFVGGLSKAFLAGIGGGTLWGTIPEPLFFAYQLTFAIITPLLIVGAFAERMKFQAMLLFSSLWLILVYLPICHMVWGGQGAFFADRGVFDFAGGIVVHITAGIAALVACLVLGPRSGHPRTPMPPHNLTMTVTGTGMLWVGWFGFNAGSAVAANGTAATALVATQVSASTAALAWMAIEWMSFKKPSMLGVATGAVAGLAAVTPASGFVGPVGALVIGAASGSICWYASTQVKKRFGYDDSLDVFGVHGVGGIVGTTLAGVFASDAFGGNQVGLAIGAQVAVQLAAIAFAVVWTVALTWVALAITRATVGVRVDEQQEIQGLDAALHGEAGYNL
jgi:Amt family ammonium transporter